MFSWGVIGGCGRWGFTLTYVIAKELKIPINVYDQEKAVNRERRAVDSGESEVRGLRVQFSTKLRWVLRHAQVVLVAINADQVGRLISDIKAVNRAHLANGGRPDRLPIKTHDKLFILCMKGMDANADGLFLPEQWQAAFPDCDVAVMGGPCQPNDLFRDPAYHATLGIATNRNFSGVSAAEISDEMKSGLIGFQPFENILGASICGVSKNLLGFFGGLLDAYGMERYKPLAAEIFMSEAKRLIDTFNQDGRIVDSLFYAGDNDATLYSPHSKNRREGQSLIEHGTLFEAPLTHSEAVGSAAPLIQRAKLLGVPMPTHNWLANVIAQAPSCRTPSRAALHGVLRRGAMRFGCQWPI
jgi:glycerol-3-phosphate dehydrogenase (NAD(P)+)